MSALTASSSAASRGLRSAGALICISAIVSSYTARNSPRRGGVTLASLLAVAALVTSCGGDDSVSVDDYANDLCTALRGWAQELRDRQAELQAGAQPEESPESARDALQQFVDGAAAATDDLVEDIDDAGRPDTESGEEVADAFRGALEDTRGELEQAQDEVSDIPTDDPREYRAAVDDFLAELRSTIEGFDERFQDVDAPELEQALGEASACQG
jgi:hypothetical protein